MMKKLLWVGDAAVPSGFARATHEIIEVARHEYDISVLGINYLGDPHSYKGTDDKPLPIYCAYAGGDSMGIGRIVWMCDKVKPDAIVLQNDGWNLPLYVEMLRQKKANGEFRYPEHAKIPIIAIVAVDGKNFRKRWLDGIHHVIFWTNFALSEARQGGYQGSASVIPLGVDVQVFKPMDRKEARLLRGLPAEYDDAFIVGNVNRNQPRKRWDLTLQYFTKWIRSCGIHDAYLFLHCAPTGDPGIDVKQMAQYYGIQDNVMLVEPTPFQGLSEQTMRETYCSFDVQVNTTGGEGFGLTPFEGMACGITQVLPRHSSLEELFSEVAVMVPCTSTALNPIVPALNVIHGVPDEKRFVEVLNLLYRNPSYRQQYSEAGLRFVQDDRFRWPNVARRFVDAITQALMPKPVEAPAGVLRG